MTIAIISAGLVIPSIAGSQQAPPAKEVRAERFVLVDNKGRARGVLGFTPDGQPALRIHAPGETMAATMELDRHGMPRFAFEGEGGRPIVEIGVLEKEGPLMVFNGPDAKRRLAMIVYGDDAIPSFGLYDAEKRNRCQLSLDSKGNPLIIVRDEKDKNRGVLGVVEGISSLILMHPQGREGVVFQVNEDGYSDGVIFDRDGKPKWSAGGN